MDIRFFVLTALLCSSLLLAEEEERPAEDIREEAQEHLEDSYEKAALGAVGVGYGILKFSTGDPVSGAVSVGFGAVKIKESIKEFKKANELFADAREQESRQESSTCDDLRDNVDSWDVDY